MDAADKKHLSNSHYYARKELLAKSERISCGIKRHYRNPLWIVVSWFMSSVCAIHYRGKE